MGGGDGDNRSRLECRDPDPVPEMDPDTVPQSSEPLSLSELEFKDLHRLDVRLVGPEGDRIVARFKQCGTFRYHWTLLRGTIIQWLSQPFSGSRFRLRAITRDGSK